MAEINPMPLYQRMLAEMGPQHWWPAETKMEIVIGAILVQNTNWKNVDLALQNLRQATQLNPKRILKLSNSQLQQLIRPSGFYVHKAKSLFEVLAWFDRYDNQFSEIVNQYSRAKLRQALLNLTGIGEETADSLLVYVFDQPVFIADKYARNLFQFLGYQNINTYAKLKRRIKLPSNFKSQDAKEFHGLIDEFGKQVKTNDQFKQSFLNGFSLRKQTSLG
ncbi:endonuclease III domain-containing protein [Lentilactobacillus raoultii]|uniref:Endonuclease III domain-containing protein n=1 Tax=Lentilactobacillus raoultii TaxID=1987503 RepID=A0ABW3PL34_9LACO|nr:deoxyribonuclease I [Lentilactobacillus raoultii]